MPLKGHTNFPITVPVPSLQTHKPSPSNIPRPIMPERLISGPPLLLPAPQIPHLMPSLPIPQPALEITSHTLILPSAPIPPPAITETTDSTTRAPLPLLLLPLIAITLDLIAPTTAAAGTDEPEKARGEGEGDAEPGGDVDVLAEGAFDVVFIEGGVEGAGEGGVENCGGEGEGDDEEGGHAADDRRRHATQP